MSEAQAAEQAVEEQVTTDVDPAQAGSSDSDAGERQEEEVKTNGATKPNGKATLAAGDAPDDDAEPDKDAEPAKANGKGLWPEDWHEHIARRIAGDDEKVYNRELKRLQRFTDPSAVYAMARELEAKFDRGGLVKVPGKDASDEERAAFMKALGVPEDPADYFKDIKLENGAVIGDTDKPLADGFANAVHKAGATPEVVNAAMNWYFSNLEEQASALDEEDEKFRNEATKELKEEYGPAFKRYLNSISSVFHDKAAMDRLLGGRTADGRLIGDDPAVIRALVQIAREVNPIATVTEGGEQSGKSIDAEIADIEKRMRDDRKAYFKDEAAQARYRELLEAREKHRARA